jgi:hypothetical protein
MNFIILNSLKAGILFCLLIFIGSCDKDEVCNVEEEINPSDQPYSVTIKPADFLSENIVGNTYFPLISGRKLIYVGKDEDGNRIDIEEYFTGQTKVILGVTCVVVEFREWVSGSLVEVAYDWYAQAKDGNVWYFGEQVDNYENGNLTDHGGSWEAGVDGAQPGISMMGDPEIGIWYRQEYYKGEAEDVAQVLDLGVSVTTPASTYENCLKTAEWSPLEPDMMEHKYYAPGIGNIKIEKVKGSSGYEELVEVRQ